jgi:hypothetical protein
MSLRNEKTKELIGNIEASIQNGNLVKASESVNQLRELLGLTREVQLANERGWGHDKVATLLFDLAPAISCAKAFPEKRDYYLAEVTENLKRFKEVLGMPI